MRKKLKKQHNRRGSFPGSLKSLGGACWLAGFAFSCATVTGFPSDGEDATLGSGGTHTAENSDQREASAAGGGVSTLGPNVSMGGQVSGGTDPPETGGSVGDTGGAQTSSGITCANDDECAGVGCQLCLLEESTFLFTCQDAPDLTDCAGTCAELDSDPSHCGVCGNECATGAACASGTCACANGDSLCDDTCIDAKTDTQNCGSCGTICGTAEPFCRSGICRECPTDGQRNCGNGCQSLQTDDNNCGSCGKSCSGSDKCEGGKCTGGICNNAPQWSSSVTYPQGTQVQYNGKLWRANYVTIGQVPTNTVVGSEACTNYWCLVSSC